jgi:CubicO group peptidase (beta-lactamase class C family)
MSRTIGHNTAIFMKASVLSLSLLMGLKSSLVLADEIDDFLRAEMLERKIPGLQLAVVKNGKIVKTASYGLANIQDAVAVDDDTVFTINSMTKAFTGVAIMQLVEQGKLKLDVGISEYLTDLPEAWRSLTIRQLMSHTSGLPAILGNWAKLIGGPGFDSAWALVQKKPMDFKPDTRFKYNQTNYVLVGKIIDKFSEMPFAEFITKNQLVKVGMKQTADAGFTHFEAVIPNQARAYTYMKTGQLTNLTADFAPALRTAAGMTSSAKELALWAIALQTGKLFDKNDSLEKLWQPNLLTNGNTAGFNQLVNGYALGWPMINRAEHPAAASLGGDRSALVIYPQDKLSIAVLTNLTGSLPSLFIDEIAGFYIPQMKAENGFGLPPAIKTLWRSLESKGYEKAAQVVKELQKTDQLKFEEGELNTWGYKLIAQKKKKQALAIFKLNTYLFPLSYNTYDSLAETYWLLGDTQKAVEHYKKVLELKPDNTHAKEQLKKLIEI